MKLHRLATCYAIMVLLLLLLPVYQANCQNYVEYSVQLNVDGSAVWKITSFSDINAPVDVLGVFQSKVLNLIDSASVLTHRDMSLDENSLEINTNLSPESKTTEYSFLWENFSILQGNQIILGDVFQVNNFFSQLYGDAAMKISYPSNFTVKSVTPTPYQSDDSTKTLDWGRTEDLVNETRIVLTTIPLTSDSHQINWQQYAVVAAIVVAGALLSIVGAFTLKRRKTNGAAAILAESFEVESEEGKILKFLNSSGGSLRQSDIVEHCRFSKAKTSQLLAILEKKGDITRYKKGRDKIVNLTERVKSKAK